MSMLCITRTAYAMCHADFKKLKTTADYESVIRSSVNGVPEHWIPEVAKQCVDSSPSPQGRRHAFHLAPNHVSSACLALAVQSASERQSVLSAKSLLPCAVCVVTCACCALCLQLATVYVGFLLSIF